MSEGGDILNELRYQPPVIFIVLFVYGRLTVGFFAGAGLVAPRADPTTEASFMLALFSSHTPCEGRRCSVATYRLCTFAHCCRIL